MYTVKQLSKLAGVSPRTLRFYDQIGLLTPTRHPENGYRLYGEAALLRLQQILFFRELDFSLEDIQTVLEMPDFDVLRALHLHRHNLLQRADRLNRLLHTLDHTIQHLQGGVPMDEKSLYDGFSEEQQKEYADEARRRYGAEMVDLSQRRWESYTPEQKKRILEESQENTLALAALMDHDPASPEVQAVILAWHKHIGYFYPCTYEVARALGQTYAEDPAFRINYERVHPDLPEFFRDAIAVYCRGKSGLPPFEK